MFIHAFCIVYLAYAINIFQISTVHILSPWILVLFLMQMTKLQSSTKTHHAKVPLRFIKNTIDYIEHIIFKKQNVLNSNYNPPPINLNKVKYIKRTQQKQTAYSLNSNILME